MKKREHYKLAKEYNIMKGYNKYPKYKDVPKSLFNVGNIVYVNLHGEIRKTKVTNKSLHYFYYTWSYSLTTCDNKSELKTIKDECNWDLDKKWK